MQSSAMRSMRVLMRPFLLTTNTRSISTLSNKGLLLRCKQHSDNDGEKKNHELKLSPVKSSDTSNENSLGELGQSDAQANFSIDEMILNSHSADADDSGPPDDDYEEMEYMNDDEIASEILNTALEYVPTYGWGSRSIEEAVKTLELSPSSTGMFKRGGADLVLHFIEECNNALTDHMASESKRNSQSDQNVNEFIEEAITLRLKMIIPYIDTWHQALTLLASPTAAADCLENGANMIDEIWYHAGDMSTDMNWYTKRAALAAVYASTELYMLRDNSVDFNETWDFLHRRMQDLQAAEITKNTFAHAMNDFYALASASVTTAQNILGVNNRNR